MTTPSFEPPPIEPYKALPPMPLLPPVRTVPPVARQIESDYYRRFVVSVGLSILLNFLLLALISSTGLSRLVRLSERPKRPAQRESPKLVLVPRPLPPPEPEFPRPKSFLEVDPDQSFPEKPKNADFYSEHNTVASQIMPSPIKSGDIPKVDGQNTKTMATETVRPGSRIPPSPPSAPQPAVPPAAAAQTPPAPKPPPAAAQIPPVPKTAPAVAQTPPAPKTAAPQTSTAPPVPPSPVSPAPREGDLALLHPESPPKPPPRAETPPGQKPSETSPAQPSPSSRAPSAPPTPAASPTPAVTGSDREVLASRTRLDGGVGRTSSKIAFNSEESPFARYDKRVIAKIGANWNYLIADKFYGETVGQVVISFKMWAATGRVSEVHIEENSVNSVLAGYCIQAIEMSAPFGTFPEALRVIVGDSRDATITFNY